MKKIKEFLTNSGNETFPGYNEIFILQMKMLPIILNLKIKEYIICWCKSWETEPEFLKIILDVITLNERFKILKQLNEIQN